MTAELITTYLALAVSLPLAAKNPPEAPPSSLELGTGDRVVARHSGGVSGLAFSPDGKLLATGGGDMVVRIWDVAAGKEVRRLDGLQGFVRKLVFSPDGKLLASAGDDAGVILWDVATGKEVRRVSKHANNLRTAAFSPDGKTLVSSGFDEHIGLWDVATGKQLHFFRAHPRVPYSVVFAPDGKTLASGGDNGGAIKLWDVATARQLRTWDAHTGCVYSVAYSPDGRLLVSGGGDTTARLWEVATGKEVRKLEGHKTAVSEVVFAQDGRTLLTASYDETMHLWETMTGREIRRFGKHKGWVWGAAYAPAGRVVASSGHDGLAVIWNLGSVVAPARRPAPLTAAELDGAWSDLAGADAGRALQAAFTMSAATPEQVVPWLRERLRPAAPARVATDRLERLVRDLDDRAFRVRERAFNELEKLGSQAGAALRKALAGQPALEARRRMETLVARLEGQEIPPERLQALRALRVLEELNTPDARSLLKDLAGGVPYDALTQEAATVLARLTKQPAAAP